MTNEIKKQIEGLMSKGYTFKFESAGAGASYASPFVIQVPYNTTDDEFITLLNEYEKKSNSLISEAHNVIRRWVYEASC